MNAGCGGKNRGISEKEEIRMDRKPCKKNCSGAEKEAREQQKLKNAMHGEVISDVLGSYTGAPKYDEQPVQDADDL